MVWAQPYRKAKLKVKITLFIKALYRCKSESE
jgi:hypothetical protein